MSQEYKPLTDLQWQTMEHLFPQPAKRSRGKPHTPWRKVVNSILCVLLSKVKWSSIPNTPSFATKSASHRWFVLWDKNGFLTTLVDAYQKAVQQEVSIQHPPRRQRLPKSNHQHYSLTVEEDDSSSYLEEIPFTAVPDRINNIPAGKF